MNRIQRFGVHTVTMLIVGASAHAQDREHRNPGIGVIAKAYRDSIVVRWAPTSPSAWTLLNKSGYSVERVTFPETGTFDPKSLEKKRWVVGPWSLEEWKTRTPRSDTMAAVAAQALYGKSFAPDAGMDEFGRYRAMANEQSNRFSFALLAADVSRDAAQGLGLRFVDKEIKAGRRYLYRIYPAGPITAVKIDTGLVAVSANDTAAVPTPQGLRAAEFERAVRLEWNFREAQSYFSGYYVERSEDDGKTFSRLNRVPLIQPISDTAKVKPEEIAYTDSLPRNYKSYVYRVRGITPFAEVSPPSAFVKATGRDRTPPAEPHIDTILIDGRKITIRFSKKIREPDFAGFLIGRSAQAIGPYDPLHEKPLPPTAASYVDTTADHQGTNYYVVAARDTAGNTSLSLAQYAFIPDTTPPQPPKGLTGTIDTLGVVRLKWNLGPEPDIIGYRVFLANQSDHAFLQRTKDPVKDTTFTDTVSLGTLTRRVFYRISAVDRYFNTSDFSATLALKRPDTIAPEPAQITYLRSTDSMVYLEWAPSKAYDLATTVLYRQEKNPSQPAKELLKVGYHPYQRNWYQDTGAVKGKTYEYWLVSIDSAGLRSIPSAKVMGRVYDTGVRPGITNLKAQVVEEKGREVKVTWDYETKSGVRFLVYRRVNDYALAVYATTATAEFIDTDLPLHGDYSYAIKVMHDAGGASAISKEVKIALKTAPGPKGEGKKK